MKSALLVVVLILVACSGSAPVHFDYNPAIDFSTYRSFSFDVAHVISILIVADLTEGHAPPLESAVVLSGEQVLAQALGLDLDLPYFFE